MLTGLNLGFTKLISGTVSTKSIADMEGFDSARTLFASHLTLGGVDIQVTILWWIVLVAVATWILLRTRVGNWIFAVGGDADAARAVGVPVAKTKIGLYMGVAFAAWVSGQHLLFSYDAIQSGEGVGNEFLYIIAAVIGGCLMTGGYGSAIGAAVGAFIFGMTSKGIVYAQWNPDWFKFFLGAMLLLATLLNAWVRKRAEAKAHDPPGAGRAERRQQVLRQHPGPGRRLPGGARRARSPACSATTAPASPPSSRSSQGCTGTTRAPSPSTARRPPSPPRARPWTAASPPSTRTWPSSPSCRCGGTSSSAPSPPRGAGPFKRLDVRTMRETTRSELLRMGIDLRDVDQPIGTLSGGERQCVAIARAVYFGAKVLVLDEPTAALGVKQSGVVLKYVAAARDAGLGVVLITHNPHHAYLVGDRFVLLKRGTMAGSHAKTEIALEELTRQMAGGSELEQLSHELARTATPEFPGGHRPE